MRDVESEIAPHACGAHGGLRALSPGMGLTIEAGRLRFGEAALKIDLAQVTGWTLPGRPAEALAPEERWANLRAVARRLLERKGLETASPLLLLALELPVEGSSWPAASLPDLAGIRSTLLEGKPEHLGAALEPFLGLGPGLTPSGDDLALGLLFCLNRWGEALAPGIGRPSLNRLLPPLAAKKTNRLSAKLTAAAQGQAVERLALALDGIVTGSLELESCAAHLAALGSSSACDALAGMTLVFH